MHRTRSCPAALFDLHGVFLCLGMLGILKCVLAYFSGEYHLRWWVFSYRGAETTDFFS